MSESSQGRERNAPAELPGDIRDLIRDEIASGQDQFRASAFEAKLRLGMRKAAREDSGGACRPRPSAFRRWAPVCAVGLIALAVVIAIPTRIHIAKSEPNPMLTALGRLPGIQSIERATFEPASTADPAALAASPLIGPLAAMAASSSSASDASVTAPPVFVPRYSLEQKIEILTEERPIERALVLIKSKSEEV